MWDEVISRARPLTPHTCQRKPIRGPDGTNRVRKRQPTDVHRCFAGCGGLARGFIDLGGFRAVGACEVDGDACETYRRNIDESIFEESVEGVASARWPNADVVIGGPPCQGFSQLGRRDPLDPRNTLWTHYARVLRASGAKVFVMENVPQLLASDQFALFEETVSNRGFTVRFDVKMRQTTVWPRPGVVQL